MTSGIPAAIITKHASKGVVLDAGLLLLLFVGMADPNRIAAYKRTRQYSISHFKLLAELLSFFGRPLATPQIVAEASNLAGNLHGVVRDRFFLEIVAWLNVPSTEILIASHAVCAMEPRLVARFGITDSVTMVAAARHLIVTDDGKLARELKNNNLDVIDFNHLYQAMSTD